jgi:hypothetical protein
MKTFAVCMAIAGLVFVGMAVQMGVFYARPEVPKETVAAAAVELKPAASPRARFPQDLARAAQANPVPQAAEYAPSMEPHKLVFLKPSGAVHHWHPNVREEWQAETVEETELVVVVGTQRKQFVDHTTYPNGAPPITRYIFEAEVSVVEARTGKVLANRLFRNVPRPVNQIEAWETTAIGRSVSLQQVFGWVAGLSKVGFPEQHNPTPIITQVN